MEIDASYPLCPGSARAWTCWSSLSSWASVWWSAVPGGVYVRPTAASATDAHCTHPRCARARVRMREPGVRRTAFDKNGYNERAAYLPYDPPTPHPRLDCPERLYQPNPYRQSKRRRTGLADNFDISFKNKQHKTKQKYLHSINSNLYISWTGLGNIHKRAVRWFCLQVFSGIMV